MQNLLLTKALSSQEDGRGGLLELFLAGLKFKETGGPPPLVPPVGTRRQGLSLGTHTDRMESTHVSGAPLLPGLSMSSPVAVGFHYQGVYREREFWYAA